LDELEGDAGSGVLQVGEVESRQTELRNLIHSIEQLEDQVEGPCQLPCTEYTKLIV
jgi:structural maintenance of chromosome 3 (chondroitin sulfate proteoglycan 6)